MTPAPSVLGCLNPSVLPVAPPPVKRLSCATFADWDLLRLAYQRIGLNFDGTSRPNSLFDMQAKLHESVCSPTVDIHQSGRPFLIWHRAFLFFHERALNQALLQDGTIDEDSLRLPYWQWDSLDTDFIPLPAQYATPAPGNLLYQARPYVPVGATRANGPNLQTMLGLQSFVAAQNSIGSVHAIIHKAFAPAAMSDLMMAAFDPIFYAHHSEVDRLFEKWKLLHDKSLWPAPSDTASFYDPNGNLGCYRLVDFMDLTKLGYNYEDYPDVTAAPAGALKVVLPLDELPNPVPNQWTFVADREPRVGHPAPKEGVIGFGLLADSMMRMRGNNRVPAGTSLDFLLRGDLPKRVWAATVTDKNKVVNVHEVKNFAIQQNLPDTL